MKFSILTVIACCFFIFCSPGAHAGDQPAGTSPSAPDTRSTISTTLVETPLQALWDWKHFQLQKPTLILLSNDPFLFPTPQKQLPEALKFLATADRDVFSHRTSTFVADPIALPAMTVDLALHADIFGRIVMILPVKPNATPPTLKHFLDQMLQSRSISDQEAATFKRNGDCFDGKVRGLPYSACPISGQLPALAGPSVLHIDLSFFANVYLNEIKQPLYTLLYRSLDLLYAAGFEGPFATVSASNTTGVISLRTRFLARDAATLLQDPTLLNKPLPELWRLRSQNLYLDNLFGADKVVENLLRMEQLAPNDPTVKFGFYEGYKGIQEGNKALQALAEAVALDPAYAYEYPLLAQMAVDKGHFAAAPGMLDMAIAAQPQDPFLKILKIRLLMSSRHPAELTRKMIDEVRQLPWAPIYRAGVVAELDTLESAIDAPAPPNSIHETNSQSQD